MCFVENHGLLSGIDNDTIPAIETLFNPNANERGLCHGIT